MRALRIEHIFTAAEIALPPQGDCGALGYLVARAALRHAPPQPAGAAPCAATVVAPADADAHQCGDDARHPGELHCWVVVAPADVAAQHDATEAVQFGDDVRRPGEPHCRVVVHPQDAIHHPNSQDQSKAFQAERSGLRDDRRACRDAPAECSGFRVHHQDAPAEHLEFRGDHQACRDAPAERLEFRDDHQACRDAPAYRRAVQADRLGDPVSRVPVACPPGDPDAAVSKWGGGGCHTGGVTQI